MTFRLRHARRGVSSIGRFRFGSLGRLLTPRTKNAEVNDGEELLQGRVGIVVEAFREGFGHFQLPPLTNHRLYLGGLHLQGSACSSEELQRSSCLIN